MPEGGSIGKAQGAGGGPGQVPVSKVELHITAALQHCSLLICASASGNNYYRYLHPHLRRHITVLQIAHWLPHICIKKQSGLKPKEGRPQCKMFKYYRHVDTIFKVLKRKLVFFRPQPKASAILYLVYLPIVPNLIAIIILILRLALGQLGLGRC